MTKIHRRLTRALLLPLAIAMALCMTTGVYAKVLKSGPYGPNSCSGHIGAGTGHCADEGTYTVIAKGNIVNGMETSCSERLVCLFDDSPFNTVKPKEIFVSDRAYGANACAGDGWTYDLKLDLIRQGQNSFAGKTSSWVNRSDHYVAAYRLDNAGVERPLFSMPPHSQSRWVGHPNNDKARILRVMC